MEYGYTTKDIVLNKENIRKLHIVNARQIRPRHVNSILRQLRLNKHFEANFIVNAIDKDKTVRVIDGNHRIEALKQYFDLNPDEKIKVMMVVYKNLSPDQEREVYSIWSKQIKQSTKDFINSYKDTIPMFERITTQIPCSIYTTKTKLPFITLIRAYFAAKENPFTGGKRYTNMQFIEILQQLDDADVNSMVDTFKIFKKIFNPNDYTDFARLPAFNSVVFRALYRIIHVNKVLLGKNIVIKRMTTKLSNSALLEQYKGVGRETAVQAYKHFIQILNKRSTKPFV